MTGLVAEVCSVTRQHWWVRVVTMYCSGQVLTHRPILLRQTVTDYLMGVGHCWMAAHSLEPVTASCEGTDTCGRCTTAWERHAADRSDTCHSSPSPDTVRTARTCVGAWAAVCPRRCPADWPSRTRCGPSDWRGRRRRSRRSRCAPRRTPRRHPPPASWAAGSSPSRRTRSPGNREQ